MTAEALMQTDEAPPLMAATIRAAQAGDHRAFEDLMIATEKRVSLLAWRILGDAEEVKEAVQETFLRLFRHLGSYDEQHEFFGWLYRITVNVCRDRARRRRLRSLLFLPLEKSHDRPRPQSQHDEVSARSDAALLTQAIDALPEKERLAIVLRELEELPTEEVAMILGSKPSTVRVQIRNARAKLRSWIESHGGGRTR